MFERIGYTWQLMRASWAVLKQDKMLLLFPLLSALCCGLVVASFVVPLFFWSLWMPPARQAGAVHQVLYYGMWFAFYLVNYSVITFFNTGIVSCAVANLSGGKATFGDGMRAALDRWPQILGWALLSASVGLVLKLIEDKASKVGAIVAGLLGVAFTVASCMVIPVLVMERKGPIGALTESTKLLKKTWGEQLVGHFSFSSMFALLGLPAFVLVVVSVCLIAGFHTGGMWVLGLAVFVLAMLYLITLSLVQSAMKAIFQAALYLYAKTGTAPEGFSGTVMQGAIRVK